MLIVAAVMLLWFDYLLFSLVGLLVNLGWGSITLFSYCHGVFLDCISRLESQCVSIPLGVVVGVGVHH